MPTRTQRPDGGDEQYGTAYRKVRGDVDDDAEFMGRSKIGIMLAATPALVCWCLSMFVLSGTLRYVGFVGVVVCAFAGVALMAATGEDESVAGFAEDRGRYHTRQTPLIHERRRTRGRATRAERVERYENKTNGDGAGGDVDTDSESDSDLEATQ